MGQIWNLKIKSTKNIEIEGRNKNYGNIESFEKIGEKLKMLSIKNSTFVVPVIVSATQHTAQFPLSLRTQMVWSWLAKCLPLPEL